MEFDPIPNRTDRLNLDPTDSCGVGLIVSIENRQSNRIIQLGATALANVAHRGAIAADGITGDGCGIMTDVPKELVKKWCIESDRPFEPEDLLGIGVVFLPYDPRQRGLAKDFVESTINSLGLKVKGTRTVPLIENVLGTQAKAKRPFIVQFFISSTTEDADELEESCLSPRRSIELSPQFSQFDGLHIASLSCRKILFKAMVQSKSLADFYPDLRDPDYHCRVASTIKDSAPTRLRLGRFASLFECWLTTEKSTRFAETGIG